MVITINDNTNDVAKDECIEAIREREQLAEELVNRAYLKEKKIIEEALEKAENILRDAEERSVEIFSKAKEEGYKAGKKEADFLVKDAECKASEIVNEAELYKQNILNSMSHEIIDLSFDIAEKILCYEIDRSGNAFLSIINSAVNKVDDKNATVLINEDDYMNHYSVLSEDTRVEPDESLRKGEIRILSKKGIIDASIDKQLEKAKLVAGVGI